MKNKYLHILLIVFSAVYFLTSPLLAREEDEIDRIEKFDSLSGPELFSLKGHVKNLFTYTKTDTYSETGKEKTLIADLSRIRLSPELNISDIFLVHIDYDNELIAGNYLKSREFDMYWRTTDYNDLFHLSGEPYYSEDAYYRTKLHRGYAKLVTGKLTATIGRQQIRFGSGRLWNPLDIMNPVEPTNIEGAEEQKGTDALRLEYYPADKTEIGLVLDGKRKDDSGQTSDWNANVLGRAKTTIAETEIAVMGGRVVYRAVGGADISTIVLDGTLRGSVICYKPDHEKSFLQAGGGYEYNFAMGLYFLFEYFYNQNGMNYNERLYNAFLERQLFGINERNYRELSNQILTYNQHYTGIALGYDVTALFRAELFTIYDFQGHCIFINPSLKYNVFQNIDLSAGLLSARIFGNSSKTSDFESFEKNSLFFTSLAWYF